MKYAAAVIDTNVVVAGLLTKDSDSPTEKILDGMLLAAFPFLLSTALIDGTGKFSCARRSSRFTG